jgi:TRAP-type mannitol/chloroaromatic compound transport system permease large subunit
MIFEPHVPSIANVIQLSIAPVFMLTAIGSFLGVLANRLARAVDRARTLESTLSTLPADALRLAQEELAVLSRRVRWVHRAITSCTVCALLISLVIGALFSGAFFSTDVALAAASLFVLAMIALTVGLLSFLREVFLATRHLRIGSHRPGLF